MKTVIQLMVIICSVSISLWSEEGSRAGYSGNKENLHIYILIGQSNMAGRAPFTDEEAKPIDRCYLLTGDNKWEPAKIPLNIHSNIRKDAKMQKMNPGYMFARTMLEVDKDISIGLVVNAKGGSKIEQWKKGAGFYEKTMERVKEALKTGTLKGILWHQGESDEKNENYLNELKILIENLRSDLGAPNLPFVAGEINNVPLINGLYAKLPSTVPNTAVASAQGLKAMDRWHFDADSMRMLGTRYAEAMMQLQKKAK